MLLSYHWFWIFRGGVEVWIHMHKYVYYEYHVIFTCFTLFLNENTSWVHSNVSNSNVKLQYCLDFSFYHYNLLFNIFSLIVRLLFANYINIIIFLSNSYIRTYDNAYTRAVRKVSNPVIWKTGVYSWIFSGHPSYIQIYVVQRCIVTYRLICLIYS